MLPGSGVLSISLDWLVAYWFGIPSRITNDTPLDTHLPLLGVCHVS